MIDIFENAKESFGVVKMWGIKNAPTILTVIGSIGVLAGTVAACVQTKNVKYITDDRNMALDALDYHKDDMTEKAYRAEVRDCYICWSLRIAKNYAVPAAIEIVSLAFIWKGHVDMLTRCAALGTLLTEALQRESILEQRIREEYGEDVLNKLKYGDPTTVTELYSDGTSKTHLEYDDSKDWSFVWSSGQGSFSDNDPNWNDQQRRGCNLYMNNSMRLYGSYASINDIYRYFGRYDLVRSEYDAACIGFPNKRIAPNYEFYIYAEEIPGTTGPDKEAPDLRIYFKNPPIPCLEMNIDAGFQAS